MDSESLLLYALRRAPTIMRAPIPKTTRGPTNTLVKKGTVTAQAPKMTLSSFDRKLRDSSYIWGGRDKIPKDVLWSLAHGTEISIKSPGSSSASGHSTGKWARSSDALDSVLCEGVSKLGGSSTAQVRGVLFEEPHGR